MSGTSSTRDKASRLVAATDGSALGNPGPAGWAWVAVDGTQDWASARHSTNNRMELIAVHQLLRTYPHTPLQIQSDSQYVINVFTSWLPRWLQRGMRTSKGRPVENQDLIEQVAALLNKTDVEWEWVRGHNGHPLNEHADRLARFASQRSAGAASSSSPEPPRLTER